MTTTCGPLDTHHKHGGPEPPTPPPSIERQLDRPDITTDTTTLPDRTSPGNDINWAKLAEVLVTSVAQKPLYAAILAAILMLLTLRR